jgi:hypothetical protein
MEAGQRRWKTTATASFFWSNLYKTLAFKTHLSFHCYGRQVSNYHGNECSQAWAHDHLLTSGESLAVLLCTPFGNAGVAAKSQGYGELEVQGQMLTVHFNGGSLRFIIALTHSDFIFLVHEKSSVAINSKF